MITLEHVSKVYSSPQGPLPAVNDVSLQVDEGDIYGLIGFSGAGKSTLLRMINVLERPDRGSVIVKGKDLTRLPKQELLSERRSIGMIFQHFHLLNNRTAFENVSFALEVAGVPGPLRKQRVQECLDIVGLSDKALTYPSKLSGGQKQRVAIARALANKPDVLLCDEPTSALDPYTTDSILDFLQELNRKLGITIVVVTHEMHVIHSICNKVSVMEAGRIAESFDLTEPQLRPTTEIASFLFRQVTTRGGAVANDR